MINKDLFKKPNNILEGRSSISSRKSHIPDTLCRKCPGCKKTLFNDALMENQNVCTHCGFHFSISARQRIELVADSDSFTEFYGELSGKNILDFPDYDQKLQKSGQKSGEIESVICGTCKIDGYPCAIYSMEGEFMMGSLGVVTGEKLARLFEYAAKDNLPVVGFTISGGARMQEGIYALMQMAKVSGAVKLHSDSGNLYVCVLCNPTAGGVTASFAMQADITIAEPGALICFAGPRVIEQTIRQKLPAGFQSAEFLLEKGFLDGISPRVGLKEYLSKALFLHQGENS